MRHQSLINGEFQSLTKFAQDNEAESVVWLNSLLKSIWPIMDPGLFTSIGDILEDSLATSMPSGINGVRVADIGQGSEPIRFLGIRWLKAGEGTLVHSVFAQVDYF